MIDRRRHGHVDGVGEPVARPRGSRQHRSAAGRSGRRRLITPSALAPGSNSFALARKYASIEPCRSRWSSPRLVNTPAAKRVPVTLEQLERVRRDLHHGGRACRRRRSRRAVAAVPAPRAWCACPTACRSRPAGEPTASKIAASRATVVVLPFVPVTPTVVSCWLGLPLTAAASQPERGAHVVDDDLGDALAEPTWSTMVDDEHAGTGGDCRRGEVVAIGVLPANAGEGDAGSGLSGVVGDRRRPRRSPSPTRRARATIVERRHQLGSVEPAVTTHCPRIRSSRPVDGPRARA